MSAKLNRQGLDLAEYRQMQMMQQQKVESIALTVAKSIYEQLVLDAGREQIAKCKSELAASKIDPTREPDLSMEIDFGPILTVAQAAAENFLTGMGLVKHRENAAEEKPESKIEIAT